MAASKAIREGAGRSMLTTTFAPEGMTATTNSQMATKSVALTVEAIRRLFTQRARLSQKPAYRTMVVAQNSSLRPVSGCHPSVQIKTKTTAAETLGPLTLGLTRYLGPLTGPYSVPRGAPALPSNARLRHGLVVYDGGHA